jgi:hypothetical protein
MNVEVSQIDVALTVSGTAQGQVTVAATTGFLPGAICQLYQVNAGTLQSLTVQITDIPDAIHLNVRKIAQPFAGPAAGGPQAPNTASAPDHTLTFNLPPNYGRSDVSAFTTGNAARICQNAQIVRTEPAAQAAPLM